MPYATRIAASLALALSIVPALSAADSAAKPPFEAFDERGLDRIEAQLHQADWRGAEETARKLIRLQLPLRDSSLSHAVAYLAVSEANQEKKEDALWHWQEAHGLGPVPDIAGFGAGGAFLAGSAVRKRDEAPKELDVHQNDETGGGALTPAHKVAGEAVTVPGTRARFPRGAVVQAIVDVDGKVRQPVVIGATFPALAYSLLEAMRGWRYAPAESGGKAVASFVEMRIPSKRPFEELGDFQKSPLGESLVDLKAGRFAQADKRLQKLWRSTLDDYEAQRPYLGVALFLRSVADLGLGREDEGICRFQAAQTLEPNLYGADLAAFGTAGARLSAHPWRAPFILGRRVRPVEEVEAADQPHKPEPLTKILPIYPRSSRSLGQKGTVVVSSVIEKSGVIRDVVLLSDNAAPALEASALDAVCAARFKPATLRGESVSVTYNLTINFQIEH